MSEYISSILEQVNQKDAAQPEFYQAVAEVLTSLAPVIEKHPKYREARIIERIIVPERVILFEFRGWMILVTFRSIAASALK